MKYLKKFNESSSAILSLKEDVYDCFNDLIDENKIDIYLGYSDEHPGRDYDGTEDCVCIHISIGDYRIEEQQYNEVENITGLVKMEENVLKLQQEYLDIVKRMELALELFNKMFNKDNSISVEFSVVDAIYLFFKYKN